MKVRVNDYPWKHWIVDDFLDENTFQLIKDSIVSFPKAEENSRVNFFFRDRGYHTIHNILRENFLEFTKTLGEDFTNTTVGVEYMNVGKGFNYETHCDSSCKIFTIVLYISDRGNGTKLYSSKEVFENEVEWKPNRAVGFYRSDNSWHSYYSDINDRTTVNIFADKL